MNRKRWAPAAAVAAALAVLVGVSFLSHDGGAAGPPLLRLAAADGSFAAADVGGRGSYRLIGALPDGPSEARVRDLPGTAAPEPGVRALAVALGEAAAPIRVDGGWRTGDLVVNDQPGNPWTWGATCGPDTPVSSNGGVGKDLGTSICAYGTVTSGGSASSGGSGGSGSSGGTVTPGGTVTSGGSSSSGGTVTPDGAVPPGTGSPGTSSPGTSSPGTSSPGTSPAGPGISGTVSACPSPPSGAEPVACAEPGNPMPGPLPPEKVLLTESQALAATAKIRDALGLGGAPTRVEGLNVVVEPLVGGLRTTGIATLLQLSSRATLVSASGSLSTGREGALYPLRSARKAFDGIPVVALGAPCGAAGCPEGPAITGARLGLSRVALDGGAAALVPAWLFTVKGSPVPLVALAVADRFLGGTGPVTTKPGTEPGTTEPDPAGPPRPPTTGKPAIPTDRERFGFDGAYADADASVLIVRYGDSGSCPSQGVHHDVVQEPDRVVVTLTRSPMPSDQPCTSDYRAVLVRVTLTAPLASREVVDGSRGTPVPISKGSPPFG